MSTGDSGWRTELVRTLTRKMVQLDSSRRLADRDGKLADPERDWSATLGAAMACVRSLIAGRD